VLIPPAGRLRAIIFDLDEVLLARDAAWRHALEEAIVVVCGERVDAAPLAAEYRTRPWRHVLNVVLRDRDQIESCESLCREFFGRSAMKKLLVHEGIGMALDSLRARQVEMGAISREPHPIALKQVQSTGLDRFLSVLSAQPEGEQWDALARFERCLRFLEYPASACAFVSHDAWDLETVSREGAECYRAGWANANDGEFPALSAPGELAAVAGMRTGS